MTVLESLGLIGIGLVLLLAGAEALVRGASTLALRFGISPLVVGLTVVAFGTSSPELMVSLGASLRGQGGVAAGNVVGSNIANLGLIVGAATALAPMAISRTLLRFDMPVMVVSMLLLLVFMYDGGLSRLEGGLLSAGILAYTFHSIRASRRAVRAAREVELPPEVEAALAEPRRRVFRHVLFAVGGVALLVYGADLLVRGAVDLARDVGVSEAVIGLTLVAIGTSLPELATTLVAAARRQGEMALGNAIGSNIFNVFGVIGPVALIAPFRSPDVGWDVLAIMVGIALLTFLFLATGERTRRWEGFALLGCYALYLWWIVPV